MTATPCADVEIRYKGNGVLKQYTFPFTYLDQKHINVALWDDTTKVYQTVPRTDWSFANPTTIQFNTAPPAPPTHSNNLLDVFNIRIYRQTDLSSMDAQFYPGSAIRASDLNDDFDQLRLALQEARCQAYGNLTELNTTTWKKYSVANSGDTITKNDQLVGTWTGSDNDKYIATTDAISARLDPYLQDTLPTRLTPPEREQPGKVWLDNDDVVSRFWDPAASAWITLGNTGPQGEKGDKGDPGPAGGVAFKGDVDVTSAPPTDAQAGWQYVSSTTGTAHPGFNGLNGTITKGNLILYTGTEWLVQQASIPGVVDASESTRGIVELASPGETETGTDSTRAVHPAGLKPLLDKKANLASPTFTGVPAAPTATAGTNTTQLATTEFVAAAVAAGSASVTTSDTAPASPKDGDLWYDSVSGRTFVFYDDGTSSQWVDAAPQGGGGGGSSKWNEAGGALSPATLTNKVGIGTATPASQLSVSGSASADFKALTLRNASGVDGSAAVLSFETSTGAEGATGTLAAQIKGVRESSGTNGALSFWTSQVHPTERMRITNGGRVGINTTSIDARLHIVSDGNTLVPAIIEDTLGGSNPSNGVIFRRNGSFVGSISTTNTATAYNTSSDYRLKENVVPLIGAIDRLQQIPVHRFNFIAHPGKAVDGFIAHEAQAVVPECVTGTKDEVDADGNPVYQGIDQSKLVPLLTAALQEALQKIEQLESLNASIEARLTALETA